MMLQKFCVYIYIYLLFEAFWSSIAIISLFRQQLSPLLFWWLWSSVFFWLSQMLYLVIFHVFKVFNSFFILHLYLLYNHNFRVDPSLRFMFCSTFIGNNSSWFKKRIFCFIQNISIVSYYQIWKTLEEGKRKKQPKCDGQNKNDEDISLNYGIINFLRQK